MITVLEGELDKILYSNENEDYTVARLRLPKTGKTIIIVGNLFGLNPGQQLQVHGEWVDHQRFGSQFKVEQVESHTPSTLDGMQKYLASGLINGIGPSFADRIIKEFGLQTFEILDHNPDLLLRVSGIGRGRVDKIKRAWQQQRQIRDVMVYLQSHGVGPSLAVKIFAKYGSRSIDVVRNRPYSLAMDIYGIGFIKADEIALKVGIPRDSQQRAEAGVLHVLRELGDDGHVCFPVKELVNKSAELLGFEPEPIQLALASLEDQKRILIERSSPPLDSADDAVAYLSSLYSSETGVIRRLLQLTRARNQLISGREWLAGGLASTPEFTPSPDQAHALELAVQSKLMILTGGPGTGKTTLLKVLIRLLRQAHVPVALAAPTGRAARRLAEATGHEAKTVHRLLEFNRGTQDFTRNRERPLDAHYVVIDEASMVDIVLMYHLLSAIPDNAGLLLVGDVDQLPAVGPGNVLRDMIDSKKIPTVQLTQIFRQAQASRIVTNAHRINEGQVPEMEAASGNELTDFYYIEEEDPGRVLEKIRQLVLERIPKRFRLHPVRDIQVLTPMHRGDIGAESLNQKLREWLNPSGRAITGIGGAFRVGDKVMQIRNNYDKDVFNGDIGRIVDFDAAAGEVQIRFDVGLQTYTAADMAEVAPAYAITVHKSQGSEYPAVILPLLTSHYIMLQRNLLYTAVTRARKLMVIIGSRRALSAAVRNNRLQHRCTLLKARLAHLQA